ncbi:MAG: alpha-galactosidase [Candidatus Hydrogenedentes bacterium]|nr:alpha-galactosidase [Candidatus Hydrogenedentota bacterium]
MFTNIRSTLILAACLATLSPVALATEMTPEDKALARGFLGAHFAAIPQTAFPFSFVYDGHPSAEFLSGWNSAMTEKKLDAQRMEHTFVFADAKTGLEVRCVVTQYVDFPAVEWVLRFKNTGAADTPILENIQALDTSFAAGAGDCRLYYAEGSHERITDFQPLEKALAVNDRVPLASFGGRSSDGFLPFFNLPLPGGGGVVSAVGWTGQWAAEFARAGDSVQLRAGMEKTHLVLHPGEEIRTPAILLVFWSGADRVRSQNLFRSFLLRHCTPTPGGHPVEPPVAVSPHGEIPFEGTTEANTIAIIERISAQKLPVDTWWIDAGWFDCEKNWARWIGNWQPSPERFPHGLKPMADVADQKGLKFLLWAEPARVRPGTWLQKNHPDWLVAPPPAESFPAELRYMANDGFHLLNFGNPAALAWAKQNFSGMIGELGIDAYRNDFNMYPVYYWRNGEAPDRQGINEIRYVTGLYDYFDALVHDHPGLLLDNCASGGRRIDFEMLRRALVLTRSDYLWDPVGQQCHTFGLAQWIPLTGIGAASTQPYECRSGMGAHYALAINTASADAAAWKSVKDFLEHYQAIRPLFQGDFYTLSPYSTDQKAWLAFQFDRPDLKAGVVQVFRRAECTDASWTCHLQGLNPRRSYTLTDWDNTPPQTLTGQELSEKGVSVTVKDKPGAAVLVYKLVER